MLRIPPPRGKQEIMQEMVASLDLWLRSVSSKPLSASLVTFVETLIAHFFTCEISSLGF